jgi:hypothetical protein
MAEKFATFRGVLVCELRNLADTSNLLCGVGSEIRTKESRAAMMRTLNRHTSAVAAP